MKNPPFPGKLLARIPQEKRTLKSAAKLDIGMKERGQKIISTVFNHCCGDNLLFASELIIDRKLKKPRIRLKLHCGN